MISSPVLDLYIKNDMEFSNNVSNNDNDNIIKNANLNESFEINDDITLNNEIEKIKKEILILENKNNILLNKLKEEKNKNISLTSFNNDENENIPNDIELNNILTDISNYLSVNSFDEIVPKLKEMVEYLNINIYENHEKNKIRNELIIKLQDLYISSNKINEKKEKVSIKVLWRWIKNLINNYKSLLIEKNKKEEIHQNLKEKDDFYKECCDELMNKYKVNNLEELNKFIEELIKRNNMNKKRVQQLKKILVNDNNNQKQNFKIINNKKNNNEDITFNKDY